MRGLPLSLIAEADCSGIEVFHSFTEHLVEVATAEVNHHARSLNVVDHFFLCHFESLLLFFEVLFFPLSDYSITQGVEFVKYFFKKL